jgi:predicted RNA-binding Zn-ribbon protein involved in translation (DUF1610 family)
MGEAGRRLPAGFSFSGVVAPRNRLSLNWVGHPPRLTKVSRSAFFWTAGCSFQTTCERLGWPIEVEGGWRVRWGFPQWVDRRLVDPSPFGTAERETLFRLEGCNMKLILDGAHPERCPECGSIALHRSRRKDFVESFLHHVLFISPYRCDECYERHLRFRMAKDVHHAPSPRPGHAA